MEFQRVFRKMVRDKVPENNRIFSRWFSPPDRRIESAEMTQLEDTGKMSPVVRYGQTFTLIIGFFRVWYITSMIGMKL